MSEINTVDRFEILRKHDFTCAFCGCKTSNDNLEIDHLIPQSIGGSDHENNLAPACRKCNNGKRDRIAIPKSRCDASNGSEGWNVWKRWGKWSIQWRAGFGIKNIVVEHDGGYWIGLDRVHEEDWEQHMRYKAWMTTEERMNFAIALDFSRSLVAE